MEHLSQKGDPTNAEMVVSEEQQRVYGEVRPGDVMGTFDLDNPTSRNNHSLTLGILCRANRGHRTVSNPEEPSIVTVIAQ